MAPTSRFDGAALLALCLVACGARTSLRDGEDAAIADVRRDAPTDIPTDTPTDIPTDTPAVDVSAGRMCGCPGVPGCVLPLMCCPVTRTCENPARFRCTGENPPPCP